MHENQSLWNASAQTARRTDLFKQICQWLRPHLDAEGRGAKLLNWDNPRIPMWASNAFILSGDNDNVALGNTILRYVMNELPITPGPRPFEASAAAGLLAEASNLLADDTRNFLADVLLRLAPHGTTADFQFHGYNDNMPVMWTWALLYAGENFDRPDLLKIAHANLRQLMDLLRRRGTVAEYGLGYATHRLTGIAHIAEHSQDDETRALAKNIEARLWAEIAGHWHPELGTLGGANMRGATPLSREPQDLFRFVLGDAIARPWHGDNVSMARAQDIIVELGADPKVYAMPYPYAYAAEFASATYHVPDAVAELFFRKALPFRFACTAEVGYVNEGIFRRMEKVRGQGGVDMTIRFSDEVVEIEDFPDNGAQPHQLKTFTSRNYSLGSATSNWFGNSLPMTCQYLRTATPNSTDDIGLFTMRYNVNDKETGRRPVKNSYPKAPDVPDDSDNYCGLYRDNGRHFCLQHDNTLVCLSTPQWREHWAIRDLRLDLHLLNENGAQVQYCLAPDASRIDIADGPVYFSIRPLIGRNLERREAIRCRQVNEWFVISLYNYEGPSRSFGKREIAKLGNGFVLEVREADEFADFASFQAEMAQAKVFDQLYGGRRRVHYARPGLRLSTHYCPYTHTVLQASINGIEQPWEKLSFGNGLERDLPFMDGTPSPGFDDWDWIETQMNRKPEPYNPQD